MSRLLNISDWSIIELFIFQYSFFILRIVVHKIIKSDAKLQKFLHISKKKCNFAPAYVKNNVFKDKITNNIEL